MEPYAISAFVTVSTSLLTFYLAYNTGMTRMKEKAPAYSHTESEKVMIANRAHMNTVELSVVYLPILWVATFFGDARFAGFI